MDTNLTDAAFAKLITDNQGLIHKVCIMYCRNEEYRKDLFQEIVLQLWRSYPSFKGESKVSTWMYRIALNTAISGLRKEARAPSFLNLDALEFQFADSNEAEEMREQMATLEIAIAQLSEIDKAIMMLYFEEVSYEEIAETLGITQNNVRVKMNRIRERLKKIVKST